MTRETNLNGFVVIGGRTIRAKAVDAVFDGVAQRMTVGQPGSEPSAQTPEKCVEVVLTSGRSVVFFDITVEEIEELLHQHV